MQPFPDPSLPADLQALLAAWRQLSGRRRFPDWGEFPPDLLAPLGDRLHVIEQLEDGDFYFHRFSPISAARLGHDMTGHRLSEVILDDRAVRSTSGYRRCLTLARPMADTVPATFNDGAHHTAYDRLLLPFGTGEKPTLLLAALYFRPA